MKGKLILNGFKTSFLLWSDIYLDVSVCISILSQLYQDLVDRKVSFKNKLITE